MEAKAIAKNIRISADKTRLVVDLIRGKKIEESVSILNNMNKKAAREVLNVLKSAIANAENNHSLQKDKLYVSKAYVNEGAVIKRIIMDSRGHTGRSDRRTSHITIVVSEK